MKNLIVALLCFFAAFSAFGAPSTNQNALTLLKKIELKQKQIRKELRVSGALIKILTPDLIRQGDSYGLYFQSNTEVSGTNSLIDLEIDGSSVALEQPASGLFIYHSDGETEIKTHNAIAKLSIEDASEAKSIRDAVLQLDAEIQALQDEIDEMEPGSEQDALIAQRDEKTSIKNQLIAALVSLKTPIGEEAFTFRITAAVGNNPNFFRILTVSPSFGPVQGGTDITITGQRFPEGLTALLGGVEAPLTRVSSTELHITSPDFTAAGGGLKNLELKLLGANPGDPVKNAVKNSVFYAANIDTPQGNLKPVAVAGSAQSVSVGAQVSLNGSGSYDENPGTALSYSWKAISVPSGSNIPTGVVYSTSAEFSYTPSKAGTYVWELVVSDGELFSEPSLTVVTANSSTVAVDDLFYDIRARDGFITVSMGVDTLSSSTGEIASVVWDFGDGTVGASSYPYENDGFVEHDYLEPGTYTATVTMTDGAGTSGSNSITFSTGTSQMPVARVTSDVFSGPAPLTVQFDASGSTDDEGITSRRYRWNDGSPDESDPTGILSHTFTEEGDYEVRVTQRDADQNRVDTYIDIHVGDNPAAQKSRPIARMDIGAKEVLIGSSHAFSGANSFDPNASGSIADYRWNFGDYYACDGSSANPGCVGSGPSVAHAYTEARSYWSELEVEGALGALYSVSKQVFAVNAGHAPRAVPGWNELEGVAPYTLNLNGAYSYDYDGTISSYRWTFSDPSCPDGCPITTPTGSRVFSDPGAYYVSLDVEDNDGNRHEEGYTLMLYPSKAVKTKIERAVKTKQKTLGQDHERDEEKNRLAMLCFKGKASACFEAGKMYEEDGNSFAAAKFFEKACSLGYEAACSAR